MAPDRLRLLDIALEGLARAIDEMDPADFNLSLDAEQAALEVLQAVALDRERRQMV